MKSILLLGKYLLGGLACLAVIGLLAALRGYYPTLAPRSRLLETGEPLNFDAHASAELFTSSITKEPEIDNLILLIADGTGFSHIQAARAQLVGPNGRLSFEQMPVTGWLTTYSSKSIYTDSASAATALATGCKTLPGRLSVRPDGSPCRTLAESARQRGMKVGLITDSYFYDATMAAFVVHEENRRNYETIISKMAGSDIEILVGSVRRDVSPEAAAGFADQFDTNGFTVAHNWQEILESQSVQSKPLAAILDDGVLADSAAAPTLRQLLNLSLDRLAGPAGFLLVIETEDPDTGSHDGNLAQAIRGIQALAEVAVGALEFARQDGRTLVIFTSDHETGGLSLLGGGQGERLRYRWNTSHHTGAPVPLYAFGPGAESFSGTLDNTEVAPIIASMLGLNLRMPPEEIAPLVDRGGAN